MALVIFDMDGVLVDSEPLHFSVEKEVFRELGIHLSASEHHALVGMTPLHIWTILRERFGLEPAAEDLKNWEARRKAANFERREIPLVPGVRDLLLRLQSESMPLALASSSPRVLIDLFTRKSRTAGYFQYMLSGEEVARGKPAPDIFLRVADEFEVAPEACTVIEDSHNGLRAALAAGMRCVGFQNPHSGQQDLRAADLLIDAFSPEAIERVLALARREE
jgi:HAD superfamily hydrolase (TIGR01509 family)